MPDFLTPDEFQAYSRAGWDEMVSSWSLDETVAKLVQWAQQGLPEAVESAVATNSPSTVAGSCELGLALAAHWRQLLVEQFGQIRGT